MDARPDPASGKKRVSLLSGRGGGCWWGLSMGTQLFIYAEPGLGHDLLSQEEAGVRCTSVVRRTHGRDRDGAPGKGRTRFWRQHTISSCCSCRTSPVSVSCRRNKQCEIALRSGQDSLRKLLWSQVSGCCRCGEVWGWGMALHSICPPLIPRQTQLFHLCSRSRRAHHTSHLI